MPRPEFDRLRVLVLDVGGVLMDERRTYRRFRRQARARLSGVDAHMIVSSLRSSIRTRASATNRHAQHALMQLGAPEELSTEIWAAIGNADRPYSEAAEVLQRLSANYRLAILGNQGADCRPRLEVSGLLKHVEIAVISVEVGLEKPDPRVFRLALDHLGIEPWEAAMVGDRLDLDIGPARRLGMTGVRMLRGPHIWQRPADPFERPDLTVRSLTELALRLER